ncbi:MAG: branched-chain amino acid transaminase [Candidatus Aminicenantes bacterium]|nr:branched-chain amino acid transaminase [Candidatus Aminicenantes bacterium]
MFLNTHFPKARKYWYEGKFYDWSEGGFHPMMHALHYGTSVFEGIRAYSTPKGPSIFRLAEHNERFLISAAVAKMKCPYSKEQIAAAIQETVRENALDSCYIRPLLFYSYGNLGLVPKACPVELAVSAWEWGAYLGENAARGVNAYIVPWRRVHHTQFNMSAKLGGVYVQSTICGLEAREEGFDEAIFLNMEGRPRRHHPDEPARDRQGPGLQDRRRADHEARFLRGR